jgi:hypothetical protein
MKIKWIVIAYLIINIILALIPDLHRLIGSVTADWNDVLRILMHFFFDPTAYVWKWIIGLLITVIFLFKK